MIACPLDVAAQFVAGQVTNTTIARLWNESHYNLQAIHSEGRFEQLPAPCAACQRWVNLEATTSAATQS
jgi:hypothetical protein